MQKLLNRAIQSAIIIILMLSCLSVSAGWPYHQFNCGWYLGDYYSTYSQESVPYYALHPPVYYSYPVARTYGLYPFPYYVEATPCHPVAIEPKMVMNGYMGQQPLEEPKLLSQQPLRIANPFVEQTEVSSQVKKANWENPILIKPKVVYPSKLTSAN
jgi:hypothetical protein